MSMSAALIFAASCNKVELNNTSAEGDGRVTFTAIAESIGGGTKAHNQYSYDVLWDRDDKIFVTDGTHSNTFTLGAKDVVTGDMTLYAKWVADPLDNEGNAKINGHEYVKLAGYYWATENVIDRSYRIEADDTYGDYFDQLSSRGSYFDAYNNNAFLAAKWWGSEGGFAWTLPSVAHWNALINYCYWEWTDSYDVPGTIDFGKSGCVFYDAKDKSDRGEINTGSGYSTATDPHIFLPAAGSYDVIYDSFFDRGEIGLYWSSDGSMCLRFVQNRMHISNSYAPEDGLSVRAVAE